ncbi:hypothetical protein LSTR_LSTR002803 [Laodelphax striatellus]|uniref:RING-type domain-containing protein n=1 Tax=Laodelphax striatellus TaxID=195883 RepID=A0A482XIK8_LAOST|nr:hypothetical protein LSTR_LSTR002803 [Laodelphax striatellus]
MSSSSNNDNINNENSRPQRPINVPYPVRRQILHQIEMMRQHASTSSSSSSSSVVNRQQPGPSHNQDSMGPPPPPMGPPTHHSSAGHSSTPSSSRPAPRSSFIKSNSRRREEYGRRRVMSGKRLTYPITQVIDLRIYDVEDNNVAAMANSGVSLASSYSARALFGEQHSPLLDEIMSAFDNYEDTVSEDGVSISVVVSEEHSALLTHYSPQEELQVATLADTIGTNQFINISNITLGNDLHATDEQSDNGEVDEENLGVEIRCPVCLTRRKSVMLLPCTHMVCLRCVYKLASCPLCRNAVHFAFKTFALQ